MLTSNTKIHSLHILLCVPPTVFCQICIPDHVIKMKKKKLKKKEVNGSIMIGKEWNIYSWHLHYLYLLLVFKNCSDDDEYSVIECSVFLKQMFIWHVVEKLFICYITSVAYTWSQSSDGGYIVRVCVFESCWRNLLNSTTLHFYMYASSIIIFPYISIYIICVMFFSAHLFWYIL